MLKQKIPIGFVQWSYTLSRNHNRSSASKLIKQVKIERSWNSENWKDKNNERIYFSNSTHKSINGIFQKWLTHCLLSELTITWNLNRSVHVVTESPRSSFSNTIPRTWWITDGNHILLEYMISSENGPVSVTVDRYYWISFRTCSEPFCCCIQLTVYLYFY